MLSAPGSTQTVATMEYIDAADDDGNDVFVDIRDSIHSLHFIFEHFFDESVTREAKWHHRRIKWEAHVVQLQHENLFKRTYRMTLQSFQKLTRVLGKNIVADESCCPVHEHIYPEIVVAVGLRYLSGGKCVDLKTGYVSV